MSERTIFQYVSGLTIATAVGLALLAPTTAIASTESPSTEVDSCRQIGFRAIRPLQPNPTDSFEDDEVRAVVKSRLEEVVTLVRRYPISPVRAGRAYAYVVFSMRDALADARAYSQSGAVASPAIRVDAAARAAMLEPGVLSSGAHDDVRSVNATGLRGLLGEQLGSASASRVLNIARSDGADEAGSATGSIDIPTDRRAATEAGVWVPTAPEFAPPLEPGWGNVLPVGLSSLDEVSLPSPPAWDSRRFREDRAAFARLQQDISDADIDLAFAWRDDAGTPTPAGTWLVRSQEAADRNDLSIADELELHALVTAAMHDAFIASWANKYRDMVARPVSWMRLTKRGWRPVVPTPPFPSYPSGHATISAAAAEALSTFLPNERALQQRAARDAAWSRVVGGVHWDLDGVDGRALGARINHQIIANSKACL